MKRIFYRNKKLRRCSKCKKFKLNSLKFFRYRNEENRNKEFRSSCRMCELKSWTEDWYKKNKESRKQYKSQDWYLKYNRIYAKKYASLHKKERSFWQRRRVIRRLENGGNHTLDEWEDLKKKFGYRCLCCNRKEPFIKLTADHVIPLNYGGRDDIKNIQPLCLPCNCRKRFQIIDFRKLYGRKI